MQTTDKQGKFLKISEQSIPLNADDNLNAEPVFGEIKELFDVLANGSLKNKQLVAAITVAVISALGVLAVIQISAHTIGQQFSSSFFQLANIGLASLIGLTVGLTNWALGRISTNQIKRSLDNLQSQFRALDARLNEAEQKAEREEKEKEELQIKMSQILQNIELKASNDLTLQSEFIPREDEEGDIETPGTLLDFLDNLHNWFKVTTTPEQLLGSSTLEEVQQRKDELQYRQVWLQALEEETNRELQLLSLICESSEPGKLEN